MRCVLGRHLDEEQEENQPCFTRFTLKEGRELTKEQVKHIDQIEQDLKTVERKERN